MDHVISESCFKGAIFHRNNSFVKFIIIIIRFLIKLQVHGKLHGKKGSQNMTMLYPNLFYNFFCVQLNCQSMKL